MTPTIRHLPLRPDLAAAYHDNMTPAEVAAWLDERELQRQRRGRGLLMSLMFWVICGVLLLATIGFFTH